MSIKYFLPIIFYISTFSIGAQATLIGQEVTCSTDRRLQSCSAASNTVGQGVEFTIGSEVAIDLGAESILLTNITGTEVVLTGEIPGMLTLGNLVWVNDPSATLTSISNFNTNIFSILPFDISVGPDSISIFFVDVILPVDGFLSFDLVPSHSIPNPIPLPASVLLLGFGLSLLGLTKKLYA